MRATLVVVLALAAVATHAVLVWSSPAAPVTGNLTLVATGFSWAENLWFDDSGHMFVSDFNRGILYRLTAPNSSSTSSANDGNPNANGDLMETNVTKTVWAHGFKSCAGLTLVNGTLFMAAQLANGDTAIVAVDPTTPEAWHVYANTTILGNGLAFSPRTAALYTACEAGFVPLLGKVLEVPVVPSEGGVAPRPVDFASYLWSSDGAYVAPGGELLFVSEVLTAKVLVYNVTSKQRVGKFSAPGMHSLDDYCVVRSDRSGGFVLLGADFLDGSVVAFGVTANGTAVNSAATVLATGLRSPTSVRLGEGRGWVGPGRFYVTEGGSLVNKATDNRRVWRLDVDVASLGL